MHRIAAGFFFLIFTAQDALSACNPKDFFDTSVSLRDDLTKIAFLENISEAQYEDIKKGGKLGATIPIEGIPINFSGSYNEAKQMAYQMKRLRHLDVHDEHHLAIFTSILSDNGLRGYSACLTSDANVVGTFLSASRDAASSEHFFVNVTWRSGVGGTRGKFDFVGNSPFVVIGGKVVGAYANTPPKEILHGQTIPVEVERDLKVPFKFTTSVNGNSTNNPEHQFELPANAPTPLAFEFQVSEQKTAHSEQGHLGDDNQTCEIHAATNEEFVVGTAALVGTKTGYYSFLGIEVSEPKRIVFRVQAYTNSKEVGAFATTHVSVLVAAPSDAAIAKTAKCIVP